MSRPRGEAPERAAQVATALEAGGHEVRRLTVTPAPLAALRARRGSPVVIHAVGADAAPAARLAARLTGAALVCDPLAGERAPTRRSSAALRDAATRRRGGAVLARDTEHAQHLRRGLGLPYIPPVVGALSTGSTATEPTAMLLALYDRLPDLHPHFPQTRAGIGRRVRAWVGQLREPLRGGAMRRPSALIAYLRGRRLRSRGRLPAAVEALTRARDRDPARLVYALYLAKALRESGAAKEALELLEQLAEAPDAGARLLGEVGVELTRLGQRARAEALAARLAGSASGPDGSADFRAEAARVYGTLGVLGSARELALRAAEEAPDASAAQRTAAQALENAGEPSRALELARRAGEREQQRRLEGVLRELEPGWTPALPKAEAFEPANPPRVLSLLEASLPQAPSGYAYRSRDVLRALRTAGFETVAATRLGFPASRGIADWSPIETVDGVVHHRLDVPGMRQYSGIPLDVREQENADRLLGLVQRIRPAAIVAGTPDLNGKIALALRSATGVPVIYDVRGFPEMSWATQTGGADTELYRLRREAETACASAADAVITLSETMRSELAGRGLDSDRIFVVPQIVDAERFAPRPRGPELAASYGLEGKLVVGSVTSLTDYEGMDLLIRAIAGARADWPEIAGLIVGDGRYRPALEELVDELGIRDAIVFTGRIGQDRVPDHYALLDLFAIPRLDLEVCRAVTPLKPFEALSMGIPVIASDLPALAEIVHSSGGGRTFAPGSADGLASAIVELGGDTAAREELGRSGREHVLTHHTPERASAEIRLPIERLLGHNGEAS